MHRVVQSVQGRISCLSGNFALYYTAMCIKFIWHTKFTGLHADKEMPLFYSDLHQSVHFEAGKLPPTRQSNDWKSIICHVSHSHRWWWQESNYEESQEVVEPFFARYTYHYPLWSLYRCRGQESGDAGRDGKFIFQYPGSLLGHVTNRMKEYCKLSTDKCRWVELLPHFPSSAKDYIDTAAPEHTCCDHCMWLWWWTSIDIFATWSITHL